MEVNTKKVVAKATSTAIEIAINKWTLNINSAQNLINFLNQGNCFTITRAMYTNWKQRPGGAQRFHIYPAIFDTTLKFVMTDDITDLNYPTDASSHIFTTDYTRGMKSVSNSDLPTGTEIPIQEGLERIFRWSMSMSAWITQNVPVKDGIFQIFDGPLEDLDELFAIDSIQVVYGVFGLTVDGKADIILWDGDKTFSDGCLADTIHPIPPFSVVPMENYQLFVKSNTH
jgi:hypothetical protein